MTEFCETICSGCPFRRDSERGANMAGEDPAVWHGWRCWPHWHPHVCHQHGHSVCLGWAIHVKNGNGHVMLEDPVVAEWVSSWALDIDLIFDGNAEFIRYHRGDWFGSEDWREDWKSRYHRPKYHFDEKGQGSLL